MIVDYGRGPYVAPCRWGQDGSGDGLIVWEVAQPDADVLPVETAFGSSVWEGIHRELGIGPGEISRDGKRIKPVVSSRPGKHFHGQPEWFLTGVPADVIAGPTPLLVCGTPTAIAVGGGAGGGVAVQTGGRAIVVGIGGGGGGGSADQGLPPWVVSARGGGAGGGVALGTTQIPRGGGGGGGISPQPGSPDHIIGRGGGGGGGTAFPEQQVGRGGGAGGGIAEQTQPSGISTSCYPRPLPATMFLKFGTDPNCAPQSGSVTTLVYDTVQQIWLTPEFNFGTFDHLRVALFCSTLIPGWAWQLLRLGFAITGQSGITVTADPFFLAFAAPPLAACPMEIHEFHP